MPLPHLLTNSHQGPKHPHDFEKALIYRQESHFARAVSLQPVGATKHLKQNHFIRCNGFGAPSTLCCTLFFKPFRGQRRLAKTIQNSHGWSFQRLASHCNGPRFRLGGEGCWVLCDEPSCHFSGYITHTHASLYSLPVVGTVVGRKQHALKTVY